MLSDDVFYYGRFLNEATRSYALDAVAWNISRAIRYLQLDNADVAGRRVLDLGCGLGMQSIIFAALGCRVLGLDLDEAAIELTAKRVAYYERILDRPLAVELLQADFAKVDTAPWAGTFDSMFSMSAFSHITPLRNTVQQTATMLQPTARVYVWDINPAWLFVRRLRRAERHLPSPRRVAAAFQEHGFRVDLLKGGTAIPYAMWQLAPLEGFVKAANKVARRFSRLSFTFVIGAHRGPGEDQPSS